MLTLGKAQLRKQPWQWKKKGTFQKNTRSCPFPSSSLVRPPFLFNVYLKKSRLAFLSYFPRFHPWLGRPNKRATVTTASSLPAPLEPGQRQGISSSHRTYELRHGGGAREFLGRNKNHSLNDPRSPEETGRPRVRIQAPSPKSLVRCQPRAIINQTQTLLKIQTIYLGSTSHPFFHEYSEEKHSIMSEFAKAAKLMKRLKLKTRQLVRYVNRKQLLYTVPHDHLLLDSAPYIGPLISRSLGNWPIQKLLKQKL